MRCPPDVALPSGTRAVAGEQWRRARRQRLRDVLRRRFVAGKPRWSPKLGPLRIRPAGLPGPRSRADQQYVYVNSRYVRDRLIATAARPPRGRAARRRQPSYVLFIDIAPIWWT